jgi:hypothetical protein
MGCLDRKINGLSHCSRSQKQRVYYSNVKLNSKAFGLSLETRGPVRVEIKLIPHNDPPKSCLHRKINELWRCSGAQNVIVSSSVKFNFKAFSLSPETRRSVRVEKKLIPQVLSCNDIRIWHEWESHGFVAQQWETYSLVLWHVGFESWHLAWAWHQKWWICDRLNTASKKTTQIRALDRSRPRLL